MILSDKGNPIRESDVSPRNSENFSWHAIQSEKDVFQ
jgi:hypothetical protein